MLGDEGGMKGVVLERGRGAKARTTLNEELGQIQYVFYDNTGTQVRMI